jgi:hypothetical protein
MTWAECAAAGMSQAEAARHRGMTKAAACQAAKRQGLTFKPGRRDMFKGASRPPEFGRRISATMLARSWKTALSPEEHEAYASYIRRHFRKAEALRIIGREDLIEGSQ